MEQKNKINEKKQNLQKLKNIEDEEDEDEPEWANDNAENYKYTKIEFKARINLFVQNSLNKYNIFMLNHDKNYMTELVSFIEI